ncbi:hypothetical protein ABLE93_05440 [Xanthobacter sp. KR7-65]|uniref:hypothetical protein n=1 Tax=Xanthobacter sp. KR7-65 TaxID=3156612 RepID=UPI0032B3E4C8
MSPACPEPPFRREGADLYRLAVEAEPETNLLLRLLEPFVIHDVLPSRIDCAATGDGLSVELEFTAAEALAIRLHQRLSVMVGVRDAALATVGHARAAAWRAA